MREGRRVKPRQGAKRAEIVIKNDIKSNYKHNKRRKMKRGGEDTEAVVGGDAVSVHRERAADGEGRVALHCPWRETKTIKSI